MTHARGSIPHSHSCNNVKYHEAEANHFYFYFLPVLVMWKDMFRDCFCHYRQLFLLDSPTGNSLSLSLKDGSRFNLVRIE
jgi:hypothetical protein